MSNLFSELKRRNIFRVAGVYAVVGWLIMQVISVMTPALNLPDWVDSFFAILLIAGFPIALLFAWAFELTPDGMRPTKSVERDESITSKTGRKLDYTIIGGLALVGGLLAFQTFRPAPTTATIEASQTTDASIAVLPFADLSSDNSQEYFGDGIAEELLNVLAKIEEMQVAGRTSSFAFKGKNQDLREIGRILNVAHILEGSIRKSGDTVRVTAQLIKVDDGFHLWSETYDRDISDIFAVQDDISREISTALIPQLMGDRADDLPSAKRTDVGAYKDFLEARQLVHGRTFIGFSRAKTLLEGVIKTDPEYAPAYAVLAHVEISLSDASGSYGETPFGEVAPIAQAHLDRAFAINPNLDHSHAVQGLLYSAQAETQKAITSLEQALDINPNNLDAEMWLAFEYLSDRRQRDTAETMWKVFNKDPLYGPIAGNTISQLWQVGDVERAKQVVDRLNAIDPDRPRTRMASANFDSLEGRWGKAIKVALDVLSTDPDSNNFKDRVADNYLNMGAGPETRKYGSSLYDVYGYWIERDMETAKIEYDKLLARSPEHPLLTNQYINLLAQKGDFQGVVDYYDATWGDLRDFEKKTFSPYGGPPPSYANLALAFQKTGRDALAKDTLARMRTSLDLDKAGGATNLHYEESSWQALTGDAKGAIATLEEAFELQTIFPIYIQVRPSYDSIRNDPAFVDLEARNVARMNEERALVGLPPL